MSQKVGAMTSSRYLKHINSPLPAEILTSVATSLRRSLVRLAWHFSVKAMCARITYEEEYKKRRLVIITKAEAMVTRVAKLTSLVCLETCASTGGLTNY